MFRHISDFTSIYREERGKTIKLLDCVSQDSLSRRVEPEGRTMGRIIWHIITTIPEMMNRTGLKLGDYDESRLPDTIEELRVAYSAVSRELLDMVSRRWQDDDLRVEDDMYGEEWPRSQTLFVLVTHEIHHRAQLTVLLRQAGLKIPGLYGPSREEWAAMGLDSQP